MNVIISNKGRKWLLKQTDQRYCLEKLFFKNLEKYLITQNNVSICVEHVIMELKLIVEFKSNMVCLLLILKLCKDISPSQLRT